MFYLPRICEHCLNPSCVASCPSGAMYKREEDGIVLVDQDRCRGWRFCVSGCPYKKVYFNHRTGKAEKCTFCFPRIEAGQPTICSETCVGRLRYLGLILYDADQVLGAAATPGRAGPLPGPAERLPRPARPRGAGRGGQAGIPQRLDRGARSARRSTSWPCGTGWRCRCTRSTAPCRWSGTSRRCRRWPTSSCPATSRDPAISSPPIDSLRIPVEYLANLFTAGDTGPIRGGAAQARRRARHPAGRPARPGPRRGPARLGRVHDRTISTTCTGCSRSPSTSERYVIPPAHAEEAGRLMGQHEQLFCSLDTEGGPGMGGAGPHGIQAWPASPAHPARHPHVPRRRRPHPLQPARLGRPG